MMEQTPRRYSLVAQVGDILRMEIEGGILRGSLPSELELGRRFQVSRPTIREALEILRKGGLIESTRGQNHKIIVSKPATEPAAEDEGVIILGFIPFEELSPFSLFLINQVQEAAGAKFNVRVVCNAAYSALANIKELAARHHYRCWVLLGPPEELFEWFAASHLACIAIASGHSSAELPSLAMDMQSVMLHAFALAGQRAYEGPLLLAPAKTTTHNAFSRIQAKHGRGERGAYFHDGTPEGIRRTLEHIKRSHFKEGGRPPLLLAVRPKFALMAFTQLREQGFRAGKDFGLVSIGYENFLGYVTPSIANYSINQQRMCRKFLRIFNEILDSGYTRPGVFRMIADFNDGETFPRLVAPPAKATPSGKASRRK